MFKNQANAVALILRNQDIQQYTGDAFINFIQAVISQDPMSGLSAVADVKNLIFHVPTLLFWDKMKRYLYGTFRDYSDQVKMVERFEDSNDKYTEHIKRLIHLINEINDDVKVDYFARLTRCFLLTDLENPLYFKLAKYLSMCTLEELEFLEMAQLDDAFDNSMMASSLYQYGLFAMNRREDGTTKYVLSDFGKSLKQNCLNFDEGLQGQQRLSSYSMMTPEELPRYATNEDIDKLFENQEANSDSISQDERQTVEMLSSMFRKDEDGRIGMYWPG